MILLLGPSASCELTLIERAAHSRGMKVLRLDSEALIHDLTVCDVVSGPTGIEVEWSVHDITFTGRKLAGVINVLDDLDFDTFNHVDSQDRVFAWHEFRSYLAFALNVFPNVINPPACNNLAGSTRSLCYQWLAMQRIDSSIAVPRWVYGLSRDFPLYFVRRCRTVVSTDPFDVHRWDPRAAPWVDPNIPYLFYEAPFGHPVQVTVFDDQSWVWPLPSGHYIPETVEERIRELSVRLTQTFGLRWALTQFFYSSHPPRLTFGAIEPSPALEWAPAYIQTRVVDAVMKTMEDRSCDEPGKRRGLRSKPNLRRTLIPGVARLTPLGAQVAPVAAGNAPEARGVLVIASPDDPTAQYFSRIAQGKGILVTWWPADQLIGLSARFMDTLLQPNPAFSVYYRRPGTRDPELYMRLCLLDDMLDSFEGPIVGNIYNRGSNHSKPLHAMRCEEALAHGIRVVPTIVRSCEVPPDAAFVVKALSALKAEVISLSDLSVNVGTYPAPVQLQARVRGTNIRAHVCAGSTAAVEIQSDRLDYRFDSCFAVAPRKLPSDVEDWCVAAAAREGIVFAGIDFLYDGETYYCLEINPNPGYHVFEERLVESGHEPVISDLLIRCLTVPVTS